jgi:hypothetical protein
MTDLQEALAAAKLRFDDTLAAATVDLQRSLLDAQKDYEKAIDDINTSTKKKLADLKDKLAEVAAAMSALKQSQLAFAAMQNAPVFTPIVAAQSKPGDPGFVGSVANTTNITNNVTGVNMTDPASTAAVITNGIKYGTAVVVYSPSVLASKESGAIGAASIASQMKSTALTSAQIVANRRQAQGYL